MGNFVLICEFYQKLVGISKKKKMLLDSNITMEKCPSCESDANNVVSLTHPEIPYRRQASLAML